MKKQNEAQAQWRAQNPEKVKACAKAYRRRRKIMQKRWLAENPGYMVEYNKKWNKLHPEYSKAYSILHRALRRGLMVKPEICEQCKRVEVIEAHHEDYSKPLSVNWLCVDCHNNKPKKRLKTKASS